MQNTDARPDTLVGGLDDAAYEDGLNSDTPSMETVRVPELLVTLS